MTHNVHSAPLEMAHTYAATDQGIPDITITDTENGGVTKHETYAIVSDASCRLYIECSTGTLIGPFVNHDDALGYLITLHRSR